MLNTLLTASRAAISVVGAIIIVDCVTLIAVGKINFGSVVPLGLGIAFVAHGVFWRPIRTFVTKNRWSNRLWYGLWCLFFLWLLSFTLFVWMLQQQIKRSKHPAPEVAAIIILGSGTVAGKPTPTLAKRLDTAVPIINAQPNALVVTSGGIGFQRSRSEANIMATYLNDAHGIPLERILQEGKSTSTEENLLNSQTILAAHSVSRVDTIAIVTSDFHTIRAAVIARHQGYQQPITVASPTPLSIRYNAWFREYFAFASGWLLGEY